MLTPCFLDSVGYCPTVSLLIVLLSGSFFRIAFWLSSTLTRCHGSLPCCSSLRVEFFLCFSWTKEIRIGVSILKRYDLLPELVVLEV